MLGKFYTDVVNGDKSYKHLELFVLKGNGPNLLGRSWLNLITLNWNSVFQSVTTINKTDAINPTLTVNARLVSLLDRYAPIFFG